MQAQNAIIDKSNFPKHVAIILDGNGRWARRRGLPRTVGHRIGINRVKEIVRYASSLGIKFLTLFTFSTENWDRPKREIQMLMRALANFLDKEIQELQDNNVRLRVIGRENPLPDDLLAKIKKTESLTANNTGLTLVLALNYGGRAEIVDAAVRIAKTAKEGDFKIDELNEETFRNFLYTAEFPDPELLIRTSGELRLSNFLLWQLAYAEFYFPQKYWPDFTKQDLVKAITSYQQRQRRFGGL